MNITVIGGSGFIGSYLIKKIKDTNNIINIDKQESLFYNDLTTICNVLQADVLESSVPDNTDIIILLAAEHLDNITPSSLYYDVNVQGMHNVLNIMQKKNIKRLVFTSSVAVYGLNKPNPDENFVPDPFNHYGKSKWMAEQVLQEWYKNNSDWNINIIRPTVVFGERNRGNVYNMLKHIVDRRFFMVGSGENKKSMSYVYNVVDFIEFLIKEKTQAYNVYNYIDKPDFNMNQLVLAVEKAINRSVPPIKIPYCLGLATGFLFDAFAFITQRKLAISSVRVKKFCATTQYNSNKLNEIGFKPRFTIEQALLNTINFEFIEKKDSTNAELFYNN